MSLHTYVHTQHREGEKDRDTRKRERERTLEQKEDCG